MNCCERALAGIVRNDMRFGSLSVLVLLFVCGCASTPKPSPKEVDTQPLVPGDCISAVFNLYSPNQMSQSFVVDSSGDISLFWVGKLHVAGLTLQEAKQQIEDSCRPIDIPPLRVSVRRCQRE